MITRMISLFAAVFLLLNLTTRLYALNNHGAVFNVLLLSGGAVSLLVLIRPGFLKLFCFLLGLSLPLYGFQSYTLYNLVFEFWLVILGGLLLFVKDADTFSFRNSERVIIVLSGYVLLAIFSLQLLPPVLPTGCR